MSPKLKVGIIVLPIIVFVSAGWIILSNIQEKSISTTGSYQDSIHYCEKDNDCRMWWGPNHCGCGNKYYKFPEETRDMRPSLVCSGDPNYECKCVDNKCQ